MKTKLAEIAKRWDGVTKGYTNLKFEEARADMEELMECAREAERLKQRVAELEAHILKRNNDMQAFASEVARLANQKYADYMRNDKSA